MYEEMKSKKWEIRIVFVVLSLVKKKLPFGPNMYVCFLRVFSAIIKFELFEIKSYPFCK